MTKQDAIEILRLAHRMADRQESNAFQYDSRGYLTEKEEKAEEEALENLRAKVFSYVTNENHD